MLCSRCIHYSMMLGVGLPALYNLQMGGASGNQWPVYPAGLLPCKAGNGGGGGGGGGGGLAFPFSSTSGLGEGLIDRPLYYSEPS